MSRFSHERNYSTLSQVKLHKLIASDLDQLESRITQIMDARYRALCLTELEKLGVLIFQAIEKGGVDIGSDTDGA